MKKVIFIFILISLGKLLYCQIRIKDAKSGKEFTKEDSIRVSVKQSISSRSKTVEYFDEDSRTTKTKTVALPELKNCGYLSYIYSEKNPLILVGMPGCVDNESISPSLLFDIRVEADGYETFQGIVRTRLNAPTSIFYFSGKYNPENKPNIIFLYKLKNN
ncbi:MAG: hypothetical protein MUO72_01730 [Bacteroidales bacterium]|nr:hypothetical protein [Bacteroidales bacterium]